MRNIVILTGAGISAESGVATFRDKNGIWSRHRIEDVATPEAFARNPSTVHQFYNDRRRAHARVKPNAAHFALAKLEHAFPGDVTIVTQNIDALHEAAGTLKLIHMHGELLSALCAACGCRHAWQADLDATVQCPSCCGSSCLRPDVVWFGEMPYHMERIVELLIEADLFVSIGTSGNVYPAAGFVAEAAAAGAHTVELNLEPSEGLGLFAEAHHGPATRIVTDYVERLLTDAVA